MAVTITRLSRPPEMEIKAQELQFLLDASQGNLQAVKNFLALESGKDRKSSIHIRDVRGWVMSETLRKAGSPHTIPLARDGTALHLSCQFGRNEVTQYLSSNFKNLSNQVNSENETPLFAAVRTSNLTLEIFESLAGSGRYWCHQNSRGETVLHEIAKESRCLPFLTFVLDSLGPTQEIQNVLNDCIPVLAVARIVASYIGDCPADILNIKSERGETALDIAKAVQKRDPEMGRSVDLLTMAMQQLGFIEKSPGSDMAEPQSCCTIC